MAGTELSVMKELKGILATDSVKNRFSEVLGKKAPQFMTSIINVVSQNNQLKQCSANSIMSSAIVAASYDLPIDSNLGFSALVPYKLKPLHRQPLYENCRVFSRWLNDCDMYMSDYCFLTGLCLPSDTRMTLEEVNFVADRVIDILEVRHGQ